MTSQVSQDEFLQNELEGNRHSRGSYGENVIACNTVHNTYPVA